MTQIRQGAVQWGGNPVDVEGPELKVGDVAPANFTVVGTDMKPLGGADLAGKRRILCALPSLDTPVCDTEMRRFNQEAEKLDGVTVYVLSVDLPFAMKRWCGATGSDRIVPASDWRERQFAKAYGVWVPSKALMCRAVFVVGADDRLRHVEYCASVGNEPDYAAALAAAAG